MQQRKIYLSSNPHKGKTKNPVFISEGKLQLKDSYFFQLEETAIGMFQRDSLSLKSSGLFLLLCKEQMEEEASELREKHFWDLK